MSTKKSVVPLILFSVLDYMYIYTNKFDRYFFEQTYIHTIVENILSSICTSNVLL